MERIQAHSKCNFIKMMLLKFIYKLTNRFLIFRSQTILTYILQYLHVKYTVEYADNLYKLHPYKDNLLGLSMMLKEYNIDSIGLKLNNKNEIYKLNIPFIAYVDKELVVVTKVTNKIHLFNNGRIEEWDFNTFNRYWTGDTLVIKRTSDSIERNYQKHIKGSIIKRGIGCILILLCLIWTIYFYYINRLYVDLTNNCMLVINIAGLYISYLLLLEQLHLKNKNAERLCSLLKQGYCTKVLESSAAKLFGIISWSCVGFSYFLGNLLILLIRPSFVSYYAALNVCTLPYTLWSIGYQKIKLHQWCFLCLCIQGILWSVFIFNLIGSNIVLYELNIIKLFQACSLYVILFLIVTIAVSLMEKTLKGEYMEQQLNHLKTRDVVFKALLKQKQSLDIDASTSNIIFGNPLAPILVTIYSNPHCIHCASLHQKVQLLLDKVRNEIAIQYIFTPFSFETDESCRFLIAVYLSKKYNAEKIYNEWFNVGKNSPKDFYSKYPVDINNKNVIEEFQRQQAWSKKYKFHYTPIVFVNGYELPEDYIIDDLKYFTNLVIDSK